MKTDKKKKGKAGLMELFYQNVASKYFFLCQTLCWSVCATLNLLLRWINQKKDEGAGGDEGKYTGVTCT